MKNELINWQPIIQSQVQEMKDMLDTFQTEVLKMDSPMSYVNPVKNTIFQATKFLLEQATQHKNQGQHIIDNLGKNEINN
jgi:hypothetical protein